MLDETMLMFSTEFSGGAENLEILVPGPAGIVKAERIFEADRFALPSGETVSGVELLDAAIEATDRHVQSAIKLIAGDTAWPKGDGDSP